MSALTAIAHGLLSIGKGAKPSRSPYQVERVGPAVGGGRRGVVPPHLTPYQVERVGPAVGGGRRGVAPLQRKQP